MHGTSAPQCLNAALGQADVANLSCLDQFLQRADRFLDRHFRVDPVQVEQVDILGPESLQASLEGGAQGLRAVIDLQRAFGGPRDAVLRRQQHVPAAAVDEPADEPLILAVLVGGGRVEVVHAAVERLEDGGAGLLVIASSVPANQPHAAESYGGNANAARG